MFLYTYSYKPINKLLQACKQTKLNTESIHFLYLTIYWTTIKVKKCINRHNFTPISPLVLIIHLNFIHKIINST